MAFKSFTLDEVGTVKLYKRKGNRSLRLSVTAAGEVNASMPVWMPYASGWSYIQAQKSWIMAQQARRKYLLREGQRIGKAHQLRFIARPITTPTTRVAGPEIMVSYPVHLTIDDAAVQRKAATASLRALRLQATRLLPQRLEALAQTHDIAYKSVRIKQLKSRWGSCDQDKNIVLNLFLMQLPWELIDYVLLHELVHTRVLRHGAPFWTEMERLDALSHSRRKAIRDYQPTLATQPVEPVT